MSRSGPPSWLAWQRGDVYTLHFWPKFGNPEGKQQAGHYTGWAHEGRLAHRLTDHAMGRGAKLTALQKQAGGGWVLADVERDVTRDREHQLKYRSASARCTVCKAQAEYSAGSASGAQALTAAGWDRANDYERRLLLEMFDLEAAPQGLDVHTSEPSVPSPRVPDQERDGSPEPEADTAVVDALVDELCAKWCADLSPKAETEREAEYEFG